MSRVNRTIAFVVSRHLWACACLTLIVAAVALPGFATLFPMDRDEPRFAQASKQMLETNDFIGIRFQETARNKKPPGIYWMQAAAVAAGGALNVADARTSIWLYRVPSLLGAWAAVLLTYFAGVGLASRRAAFVAASLMAGTLLLVAEAHLAKTDAVLCATVVAAMAVLARAWMQREIPAALSPGLCATFWIALAVGILVKGPITPLMPAATAIALSLRLRSGGWLNKLRPRLGFLACLVVVLPPFLLILSTSGMAFFTDAIGKDMAGKLISAQELHGAPPGTYLAAFWLTGWPLAPFVLLAAPWIWRRRWTDPVLFALAWLVPAWLLFEVVPTKLPHYVLPLYPALAVLVGCASEVASPGAPLRSWRLALFIISLCFVPVLVPATLMLVGPRLTSQVDPATLALAFTAAAVACTMAWLAARALQNDETLHAALAGVAASIVVCGFCFGWFLNARHADRIALSPRLASAAHAALDPRCKAPKYATTGNTEPSLVFVTDTSLLMTDARWRGARPISPRRSVDLASRSVAFAAGHPALRRVVAWAPGRAIELGRTTGLSILKLSFALFVLAPSFATIVYFAFLASDQFASETRFAVRHPATMTSERSEKSAASAVSSIMSAAAALRARTPTSSRATSAAAPSSTISRPSSTCARSFGAPRAISSRGCRPQPPPRS